MPVLPRITAIPETVHRHPPILPPAAGQPFQPRGGPPGLGAGKAQDLSKKGTRHQIDCSADAVLRAQKDIYGAVDRAHSLPSPAAEVFPLDTLLRARRSKMPLISACLVVPAVTPSARSFW